MDIPATNGVVQVVENIIEMGPSPIWWDEGTSSQLQTQTHQKMFYFEELIQSKEMTEWDPFKINYDWSNAQMLIINVVFIIL